MRYHSQRSRVRIVMRLDTTAVVFVCLVMCGCGAPSASGDDSGKVAVVDREPSATENSTPDPRSPAPGPTSSDWPCFLGPTHDSKSPEQGILTVWPAEGPRIVWHKKLGVGYGICSISQGRLFQFDRYRDKARLTCMKPDTGDEVWW